MTISEAVEILEEIKTFDDTMYAYSQAYNDALDIAINVLKAQKPVEPIEYDTEIYKCKYFCGNCRRSILRGNHFCPNCGKAVKWE